MSPEFCTRLELVMDELKTDMEDLKNEQKEIKDYITGQKAQIKAFWWLIGGLGSLALFFKEHIFNFFSIKP